MARFNKPQVAVVDKNLAGGNAFELTAKEEFVSILMSSLLSDQYYRKVGDVYNPAPDSTIYKLHELALKLNPVFVAKAALYARNIGGMRSVSHYIAYVVGRELVLDKRWENGQKPAFFNKIVRRADDMSEIVALFLKDDKGTVPNAVKRGFAKAFERMDAYALGKYSGSGTIGSLYNIANLCHPTCARGEFIIDRTDFDKAIACIGAERRDKLTRRAVDRGDTISLNTLDAFMLGFVKNTDTWESKMSASGESVAQVDATKEEKAEMLHEEFGNNWRDLVMNNKLGHFALIRNLSNIIKDADDETFCEALWQLTDENKIKKSLVFPYRYLAAYSELRGSTSARHVAVCDSLNTAALISARNIEMLGGRNAIFIDISGSMGVVSSFTRSKVSDPIYKATMLGLLIYYANENSNIWLFDTVTQAFMPNGTNMLEDAYNICDKVGWGTSFACIGGTLIEQENKGIVYDNIFVISDEQSWADSIGTRIVPFNDMMNKYFARNKNSRLFSIDIAGYGTTQSVGRNVHKIYGFSDDTFRQIKSAAEGLSKIVAEIEAIAL